MPAISGLFSSHKAQISFLLMLSLAALPLAQALPLNGETEIENQSAHSLEESSTILTSGEGSAKEEGQEVQSNVISDSETQSKISAAESSIESSPEKEQLLEQASVHWHLAKKYLEDWDLELAETELELAVMNYPDMKIAHRDLCLISLLRLRLLRSLAEFMMTVGLGEPIPMSPEESANLKEAAMVKHYKKGLLHARKQDWLKTAQELELAVTLVPDDYAVQRSLAYAFANLGQIDKAEEHYQKTFELAPQDGSARADLAYMLAANGKLKEAQKEMAQAVKSQPQTAAYHVDLAFMAEKHGDLETAISEFQEALCLSPKNSALWSKLGNVLEKSGKRNEAIVAYSQAISLNPTDRQAKQSLAKLQ